MGVSKSSPDATAILNWKSPGRVSSGDFANCCYEMLSKRPYRTEFSNMNIMEVNNLLDELSKLSKEVEQIDVFARFYRSFHAIELKWIIRIILRRVTERTILQCFHPDAYKFFNVNSSLSQVCWALWDPNTHLDDKDKELKIFQCFQPQLANFVKRSLDEINLLMDNEPFWIEEKLDGERLQMHKQGYEYKWFSRKAKDYTYLYGSHVDNSSTALTKYFKNAFTEEAYQIILDGEIITWDPVQDAVVPFGQLKSAINTEKTNLFNEFGFRPLYVVFDILHLNGHSLIHYSLEDRRKALEKVVKEVPKRLEIHKHTLGSSKSDIEEALRTVIAEGSEGLIVKHPKSTYHINARDNSWIKVKPEYMNEFGENLDCLVLGGYYGRRNGNISSFLCGLRVNGRPAIKKFHSFFKVGGGFSATDLAEIRHRTSGFWNKWDRNNVPEFMELSGGSKLYNEPDEWIDPEHSVVFQVRAAQVIPSDEYRTKISLRFSQFQRLRLDKDWTTALDYDSFYEVRDAAQLEHKIMQLRAKRKLHTIREPLTLLGSESPIENAKIDCTSSLLKGLVFHIVTGDRSTGTSRHKLNAIIVQNGGVCTQHENESTTIVIADKELVKVRAIRERNKIPYIIKPRWITDCLESSALLPFEEQHIYYRSNNKVPDTTGTVNQYGESFLAPIKPDELVEILNAMSPTQSGDIPEFDIEEQELLVIGGIFQRCIVYIDSTFDGKHNVQSEALFYLLLYGSASIVKSHEVPGITHIVIPLNDNIMETNKRVKVLRNSISSQTPRIVGYKWIYDSLESGSLLDEERYAFPMTVV